MSDRITIVLTESTNKKLRIIQAKLISELPQSISFSKVLEEVALVGIENIKINLLVKKLEKRYE